MAEHAGREQKSESWRHNIRLNLQCLLERKLMVKNNKSGNRLTKLQKIGDVK